MANASEKGRKQQVLDRLREGGWVNGPELANERVGGSEGLRRLRELREDGYVIHERRHPDPARDIWQYRLDETGRTISPVRPTSISPQSVSPLRREAAPKRVELADVPDPVIHYCWHCGSKTGRVLQHALGGYAEAICPAANRRVIAVPKRELATGNGNHPIRSARSPIR
jgi:hypothetical protein